MKRRRAVITGIGAITPIGCGQAEVWKALTTGRSGIRPITRFDAGPFPIKVAGEIPDFDARKFMDARDERRYPLFAQFAVAAARLAVEDAGISLRNSHRIGACFGSSIGGFSELVGKDIPTFESRGPEALSPFSSSTFSVHAGTSAVCQILGLTGPKASMASGCTTGLDVVEWARGQVERGSADAVVVGASDAPLEPFTFGLLCANHLYSTSIPSPRPFDVNHSGSAISEGAGAVVVEELEHAQLRRATIYAEVLSHSTAGDPGDVFKPAPGDAAERAISEAVRLAELVPDDLDAIFPFALGLPAIDAGDVQTLRSALGDRVNHIPAPAIVSELGHMISAYTIMQVIAMALSLHHQQVPPTINFEKAAPGCEIDCVPNHMRYSRLRQVLGFARSLSKTYAAIVLGQVERPLHQFP